MVQVHEFDNIHEVAQQILEMAKSQGAEQAQVVVFSTENIATRFGENHITQNTQSNSLQFTLQSQIGAQVGNYRGSASSKNLKSMISAALDLVKYSPPDPEFPGFVEEKQIYPDIDRKILEYEPEDIADSVKIGIDSAINVGEKIKAVAGSINYVANRTVLSNTYGLSAETEGSTISGIMNVAARQGDNESRASDSLAGVEMKDLSMDKVGVDVSENAIRGLNQGELEIGGYPTILGKSAVMELMFHVSLAASSSMLINQQSPFKDKMGEQIFDTNLTFVDETSDPSHYSSQKFDFEGIPCSSITYIDEGIVKDFAYNRRNAKKLGVETNGRDVGGFALFRATSIKPGNKSEVELISSIDNGVYVSNLWYSNFVNMPEGSVTGLTRDGVFKIEKGEIVGSVKNMRFTDSLFSMFKEADPSNDPSSKLHSTYGNIFGLAGKLPTIKLGNFNFSSKGKH